MDEASQRLQELRARMDAACARVGRDPRAVDLVGAAKKVEAARVRDFVAAGLSDIGENYVQEGVGKIADLATIVAAHPVRWHLIGALQSNKARDAVQFFGLIHSVDRLSLASALDKAAQQIGKVQEILLQVNLGAEDSKAGCTLEALPDLAQACVALPNLAVSGLMCLPPYHEDAEQTRPYFRQLREARDALFNKSGAVFAGQNGHLSMGMSHDFEIAIEEGATLVRIGTALFGAR